MSFTRSEAKQKSTNRRVKPQLNISPIKSSKFTRKQESSHEHIGEKKIISLMSSIRPPVLVNDVILHKLTQVLDQLKTNECSDELDEPPTPGDSHFEICSFHEGGRGSVLYSQSADSTLEFARNHSNAHLNNFVDDLMNHAIHEVALANKCMQTEDLDTSSFTKPTVLRKHHSKRADKRKQDHNMFNIVDEENNSASTSSVHVEEQRDGSDSNNMVFSNSRTSIEQLVNAPEIATFDHRDVRRLDHSPSRQLGNSKSCVQGGVLFRSQRKPPFYVMQNEDPSVYISHSIKAHEQQLIHRIQSSYPHWRAFVSNLLSDTATGDDVAILFLNELQTRKQMRSGLQQTNENLHREDEHILSELKRALTTSDGYGQIANQFVRPSRMQQLRILNTVLSNC